jgi:hypothetical protein
VKRKGPGRPQIGVCEEAIAAFVRGRRFHGSVEELAGRINHPVNRVWIALASGPEKRLFHAIASRGGVIVQSWELGPPRRLATPEGSIR